MGRRRLVKILDTCFLIHLHREWQRKLPGPATRYLERHANEEFGISVVTTLEFLEGFQKTTDGERFLTPFPQLAITSEVARIGSRIRRNLRQRGEPIGDFDVLIAATAIHRELPLVTDNTRHFSRIEGLTVETYREP
jgi:predicted nucleic acid-binding protein